MGLIKAAVSAVGNVVGDQFKEYVTCPEVDANVLIARGTVNHGEGNKNYTEGVISNGSTIVVPQGFAMMIVDNGAIKEFSAEPGPYTWDTSSEPSVFEGGFFKGIGDSIKNIGNRITYGGAAAKDQRVYYVNIKTILDNKFGSPNTETVFDPVYGSVEITFNGMYSLKVVDPTILVSTVIGANPKDVVTVEEIVNGQLKMKFVEKVSECISKIMVESDPQISFNKIQTKKSEVTDTMNDLLDESWKGKYGIIVEDVSLTINASEESKQIIREMDAKISEQTRMANVYSQNMAGSMAAATGEAMKAAASNANGAAVGLMGMNMASNIGGSAMQAASAVAASQPSTPQEGAKFCSNCGASVTGKFCSQCGSQVQ